LLNLNRNPSMTKLEIENELKDFLGYLVDFTVSNEKYIVTQDVYKIYVSLNLAMLGSLHEKLCCHQSVYM
jgi:hypothetical protein